MQAGTEKCHSPGSPLILAHRYKARHAELESMWGAIAVRVRELTELPAKIEETRTLLADTRGQVATWGEEKPQITANETKEVSEMIKTLESEIRVKMEAALLDARHSAMEHYES